MRDLYQDHVVKIRLDKHPWIAKRKVRFYWVEMEDGIDPGHWETYDKRVSKSEYPIASPEWESAFHDSPDQRGLQSEESLLKVGESCLSL